MLKKELKIVLAILTVALSLFFVKSTYIPEKSGWAVSPFSPSRNVFDWFLGKTKNTNKVVYGYLPYWTVEANPKFDMSKITDIAYFGLYINSKGDFVTKTSDGEPDPGFTTWRESEDLSLLISKAKQNKVRVSLTVIAHTSEEDPTIDKFLNCRECWDNLLENLKRQLDFKGIKDVNLNFEEYAESELSEKFVTFVDYVNKDLDATYGDSFVVVSAFADSVKKPRISSQVLDLAKTADGIFIMGYDFRTVLSEYAGPLSPLGGKDGDYDYDLTSSLEDFLSMAPPNKIILGVPFYGYNWVVESSEPYSKRVEGNDVIGKSQSMQYVDIKDLINELKIETKWDEKSQTPFFSYVSPETGSQRMVYYEDPRSLKLKFDLAESKGILGVGIWALGYDGGDKELWEIF